MAAHVEIKIANWKGRGAHHERQYDLDCYPSHPGHLFSVVTSDLPRLLRPDGRDAVHVQCHHRHQHAFALSAGSRSVSGPDSLAPLAVWVGCLPSWHPHASDARPRQARVSTPPPRCELPLTRPPLLDHALRLAGRERALRHKRTVDGQTYASAISIEGPPVTTFGTGWPLRAV